MLTTLIAVSFITWIIGFIVNGFTLHNVLLIIPTIMFSIRKFGIHIKQSNIITVEVLFLIFSILWRLLFNKFELIRFIITIVVRLIFLGVVIYDDSVYVYVNEEIKKV